MAKNKLTNPLGLPPPEALVFTDPVTMPEVVAETPSGPVIEYRGAGAEQVKFNINPKATRYVVHAGGMVQEYL